MPTKPRDLENKWIEAYPSGYAELLREHGMPPTASDRFDEFNRGLIELHDRGLCGAELTDGAERLLEDLFGDNRPDPDDDEVEPDGDDIGD